MYLNHCVSSNTRKLILSYGSILNANLGNELGQSDVELSQSDVELGQSDVNQNLADEPLDEPPDNLNKPFVEHPPDEPPDGSIDKLPGINLMFCLDPIPNVANFSFYLDTNTYPTINLDNLGSSNTYENLWTDPGNDLGITAPLKLNIGPGANFDVGSTNFGIDDEQGTGSTLSGIDGERDTGSIDLELNKNPETALYDNPSIIILSIYY